MIRVLIASSLVAIVASQCSGGIPATEVKAFLAAHNALRQSISAGTFVAKGKKMPAAKTPIPNLTWDCDIEKSAQKVSNTCVMQHSTNRKNLGENLYMSWGSAGVKVAGQGTAASKSWANEFQQYGWPSVKLTMQAFNSGIGHATQMAWAKSTKIGCGITLCEGGKSVLVACQYRDAGNMLDSNVYDPK